MAKLDLDLISEAGNGRPVPKEMDRNIVKFVVGKRKTAVEAKPDLLQTERWDHSDVFYAARTWLNQHNWDTSVYNDNVAKGAARRKNLYDMIKDVCEKTYGVKRHKIGIHPDDRAVMAYDGKMYAANFDNLQHLMYNGTDVVGVEKQGTVIKMMPFTRNNGIAFIQSQGFISEYGTALLHLTNGDLAARTDYLPRDAPTIYTANLGNLTDCDSSGIVIGMKVKGAIRIGIDLDTIDEINRVNAGLEDELDIDLPIKLEDLEESNEINDHWNGLNGVINRTGKFYKSLSVHEVEYYRRLLLSRPTILGGNIRYIDYLAENRIELNTVLAIIKPKAFWNWLRWKLLEIWPSRSYLRGGLTLTDNIQTPSMNRFNDFCQQYIELITKNRLDDERREMRDVRGMYDDVDGFRDNTKIVNRAIMTDVINEVVLPDKKVQQIDLALERIMKNGSDNNDDNNSKQQDLEAAEEDTEEFDDDYDGDEWDD